MQESWAGYGWVWVGMGGYGWVWVAMGGYGWVATDEVDHAIFG